MGTETMGNDGVWRKDVLPVEAGRAEGAAVGKPAAVPEIPSLQVCIMGQDGDIILRVFENIATITVRNPQREQRAEIEVTAHQGQAISDVLLRIPCQECGERE